MFPAAVIDVANVNGVRQFIEGCIQQVQGVDIAQVGHGVEQAAMIEILGGLKDLKELNSLRRPARYIFGEEFEHIGRPFAATVKEGVGNISALAKRRGFDGV